MSSRLNFVLSFLDINDTIVSENNENNGALSNDQRQQPLLSAELSSTEADNAVHTYAAATAHVSNHGSGDHRWSFRNAVAAAVCIDRRTKERRAKSVVIAGLTPNTEVSDVENVINLCGNELNIIPAVKYARRLGTAIEGRVQPLLVGLETESQTSEILQRARRLRTSNNIAVRQNIFINPNLTKIEAKMAYDERCRRRQRLASGGRRVPARIHGDRSTPTPTNAQCRR